MYFHISFERTGDTLTFQVLNNNAAAVLEYYLDNINRDGYNRFYAEPGVEDTVTKNLTGLKTAILNANEWIHEITGQKIELVTDDQFLDQRVLNQYHAAWVKSQSFMYDPLKELQLENSDFKLEVHHKFSDEVGPVTLGTVLKRMGLTKEYSKINMFSHWLESSFNELRYRSDTDEWVSYKNIGDRSLLTNNICNFRLSFDHLGRTLYNKYLHCDDDLEFDDENTYNELLGHVTICLLPAQTIELSKEYIAWCDKNQRHPSGDYLNIGNLPDLNKNLTDYRKIIYRNAVEKNRFSIHIGKG